MRDDVDVDENNRFGDWHIPDATIVGLEVSDHLLIDTKYLNYYNYQFEYCTFQSYYNKLICNRSNNNRLNNNRL